MLSGDSTAQSKNCELYFPSRIYISSIVCMTLFLFFSIWKIWPFWFEFQQLNCALKFLSWCLSLREHVWGLGWGRLTCFDDWIHFLHSGCTLISGATVLIFKKKTQQHRKHCWMSKSCFYLLPVISLLNMLTNASMRLKDTLYSQAMCWSPSHTHTTHISAHKHAHTYLPSPVQFCQVAARKCFISNRWKLSALLCINKGLFFLS